VERGADRRLDGVSGKTAPNASGLKAWVARLARRLRGRTQPPADPWTPIPQRVPHSHFGAGARDFRWYFEGESRVSVEGLEELCQWLLECEYVRDRELFMERDFWQHPRTFEHVRKGDCEDHALWAWRKLVELGYHAELVSGEVIREDGTRISHVWVLYSHHGEHFLLETTASSRDAMIHPVTAVRERYIPHWGITGGLESRGYAGYLLREVTRSDG
jgi:hypothetical protein